MLSRAATVATRRPDHALLPRQAPLARPAGESIDLYEMPTSGPAPIVNAINSAQDSVDLSVYLLTDPKVIQALKDAAQREVNGHKVEVRVMLESHPLRPEDAAAYDARAKELQDAGIEVKPTPDSFDGPTTYDHAKFMIIDRTTSLIGTGNLVRTSLEPSPGRPRDRDFWLSDTRDEVAQEAEQIFEADWNRIRTDGMTFKNLVVTPDDAQSDLIALMDGVGEGKALLVYNQELWHDGIVEHLIAAKDRGASVQVLLAAGEGTATDHTAEAVRKLEEYGVQVKRMSAPHLHAKAIVAGDQVYVGSQNFSYAGLQRNREVGEIVADADIVAQLTKEFGEDWLATPAGARSWT